MNRFYRKPKPETMKKNRESNRELYSKEIEWCKEHLEEIKDNKFLMDMYLILITGNRKMSPKMIGAVQKAMTNPMYDTVKRLERMDKIQPILDKIEFVHTLVKSEDEGKSSWWINQYSALPFIKSVRSQLKKNGKLSEKQMQALNKIYKKYTKKDKKNVDKND